jgi:hypothetical protein
MHLLLNQATLHSAGMTSADADATPSQKSGTTAGAFKDSEMSAAIIKLIKDSSDIPATVGIKGKLSDAELEMFTAMQEALWQMIAAFSGKEFTSKRSAGVDATLASGSASAGPSIFGSMGNGAPPLFDGGTPAALMAFAAKARSAKADS